MNRFEKQIERALMLLRALAKSDPFWILDDGLFCRHCEALLPPFCDELPDDEVHTADCTWLQANVILQELDNAD